MKLKFSLLPGTYIKKKKKKFMHFLYFIISSYNFEFKYLRECRSTAH